MRTLVRIRITRLFMFFSFMGLGIFFMQQSPGSDPDHHESSLISAVVVGTSMVPTFYSGDLVTIDMDAYTSANMQSGNLVALMPPDKNELTVKRVRGVAGDVVRLEERSLYVNNILLAEGELGRNTYFEYGADYVVPEGELFLIGDNFGATDSSLLWGFISQNQIIGKVLTK